MTIVEMKRLLLLKFDGLFDLSAPAYTDIQLSDVLNNAQRRIVKDIDSHDPQREYGGFDYNERVRRYLASLIKRGVPVLANPYGALYPKGIGYELPSDCWYIRSESATSDINALLKVKSITHDFYWANIDNPYKNPDSETIWSISAGDNIVEMIPAFFNGLNDYLIVYTSNIPDMDITAGTDCILHEDLHDDIVDEAYKIITGASSPEYYNIASNEANNN